MNPNSTREFTREAIAHDEISYLARLKPYAVMRLMPNMQRSLVQRFRKRRDADDYALALSRLMPEAQFEAIYDA